MMKFLLGVGVACMVTTPEGRAFAQKATSLLVKSGDKLLKSKLGIDVKSMLEDDEVKAEVKTDEL